MCSRYMRFVCTSAIEMYVSWKMFGQELLHPAQKFVCTLPMFHMRKVLALT